MTVGISAVPAVVALSNFLAGASTTSTSAITCGQRPTTKTSGWRDVASQADKTPTAKLLAFSDATQKTDQQSSSNGSWQLEFEPSKSEQEAARAAGETDKEEEEEMEEEKEEEDKQEEEDKEEVGKRRFWSLSKYSKLKEPDEDEIMSSSVVYHKPLCNLMYTNGKKSRVSYYILYTVGSEVVVVVTKKN